ncbi:TROVE domain-containing protein [Pedobacter frigidisoli]|uniref:TROVE domain-containing protein n=1 Tax=Pedobacter frigidisoli TaxID=2530455 RepID=A0A4R0P9B6_9SPHI|nr:TROVE domain-containing protein [Pedobacter frigidisoli]TCD12637.1 TROVE domain-containing protein [Pedobacter frigidisoli]
MKFNFFNTRKQITTNHENAKAYTMTPELELYAAVVTTGLNDSFYESGNTRLNRIKELIAKCDPTFVARLAIYARTEMNLRSVPMVLSVELAKRISGDSIVSKTVSKVVLRADEITELLAYYQIANERKGTKKLNKLSKQIQKGLVDSFNRFDEYQFAKYNRNTDVKLKDALFLVHPKAKDGLQQEIFNKIASDNLTTPYTWETELSELGKTKFENEHAKSFAFTRKWEALIESKKVGYMALMRNLRNILDANVSARHIEMVCSYLSNEKAVLNSKQLPFRFLSAYRELKSAKSSFTSVILGALEDAVMCSAKNIKGFGFDTSVVIACDVSGSMQKPVSAKSTVLLYDIGLMLAMLMQSQCKNVTTGMFGDSYKVINMPKRNVLANVMEYYRREGEVGYATNGYLVIDDLLRRRAVVDKVMIFTDTQMWDNSYTDNSFAKSWKSYKNIAPNAKLYLFNLAGYKTLPIDVRQNDVYLLAGWSDKIFDILSGMENAVSALEKISQIEI